MLITDELARRLEVSEALDAAACAEASARLFPELGAQAECISGGVLTYCGPTSPLTHALGIGMHGPVTAEDLASIEAFFARHGCGVTIDVCPHSDRSLLDLLLARGYRVSDLTNVLVRSLTPGEHFPIEHEVRPCEDADTYSGVVICGFFSRDLVTDDERAIGQVLFSMPGAHSLVARVQGSPAGGCGFAVRNGVASLFADAVLPEFRGKGIHTAMIRARLSSAAGQGCDVATAGTQPGSASQRNYQRLGFEVAYTKLTMVSAATF